MWPVHCCYSIPLKIIDKVKISDSFRKEGTLSREAELAKGDNPENEKQDMGRTIVLVKP